jgi:dTMP kinase
MPTPGKFIVIEGTDGSGKTVQFERLILALPEGTKLGTLDFPQYGEPSSYFVEKYLTGKYGDDIEPYAASVFFAVDRFDVKLKTLQWLEEGRVVVANRYVASNMAHQGGRMEKKSDRERFYKWLYELEYGTFGIPKPDLNIVLHAPDKGIDAYLEIAALFPNDFQVIECAPGGTLLPPEAIHEKVRAAVRAVL